ncbi:hypothetical protein OQA88_878 [Cercophora sp. LCS_1]
MKYGTEWASGVEPLINRVRRISQLSHRMPTSGHGVLPMLRSLGYIHDPTNCEFGIVYEFPPESKDPTVFSLYTAIKTKKSRADHPSLTQRFALASSLVRHALDLHSIQWLHKTVAGKTPQPYFIGFDLARFNNDTTFSVGPGAAEQVEEYHHPAYQRLLNVEGNPGSQLVTGPERYRQEFDYYSIGLVLLEIAVWKPLGDILKDLIKKRPGITPEKTRQELLLNYMGLVASYMGDKYAGAVRRCLSFYDDMSGNPRKDYQGYVRAGFRRVVVDELDSCIV